MANSEGNGKRSPVLLFTGDLGVGKTSLIHSLGGGKGVGETSLIHSLGGKGGVEGNPMDEDEVPKVHQMRITYVDCNDVKRVTQKELFSVGLLLVEASKTYPLAWERALGLADLGVVVIDVSTSKGFLAVGDAVALMDDLRREKIELIIVLNKIDQLDKRSHDQTLKDFIARAKHYAADDSVGVFTTNAISGHGVHDLIEHLNAWMMKNSGAEICTLGSQLRAKVLRVKEVAGHGRLLFVVVIDGILRKTDKVVVSGSKSSIVSDIKKLWTPMKSADLFAGVGPYNKLKEIRAGRGVLVALKEVDVSNVPLDVNLRTVGPDDDVDQLKEQASEEFAEALERINWRY